ncbi:kinase-like domain-containing protein [Fimicolochytrium jonesii]|uniref:kinase-like domain-containing protein n=1 Tax=Fimicolochytrium jonesii TaxID=1396493 RepID=UPI0022FEAC4F|nr:kinase-like domain-containing protein [Fimicolochytrium jonesii]KAI8816832.1 kinase-like domain-containing protein [Fimicolochytrium jonesii]
MASAPPADSLPQIALEEVEALRAIYMEDFDEALVQVTTAWKVAPIREFIIQLAPHDEELKEHCRVVLAIRFTKRYPETAPNLILRKVKGISDSQMQELQAKVELFAQQLLGREMIFDIASYIQDELCRHNAVARGVKQVSFFQQMQDRREQDTKEQNERAMRELELNRQVEEEALKEQNQALASQIEEEIQKKQEKVKQERDKRKRMQQEEKSKLYGTNGNTEQTAPSTPVTPVSPVSQLSLDFVAKGPLLQKGILSSLHIVRVAGQGDNESAMLKEIIISNPHYRTGDGKKKLMDACGEIQKLTAIRHPNLVTIFDSRVQKVDDAWQVQILLEHCRGGSLQALIKRSGGLKVGVAQHYMKELLKGIAYLHSQNHIHKDVKSRNVLFGGTDGNEEIKLNDASYARKLLDLHKSRPLNPLLPEEASLPKIWTPPELLTRHSVYGRKSDIWMLGTCFLEMIYGYEIFETARPDDVDLRVQETSRGLAELVSVMLAPDPKDRPNAMEILNHAFFSNTHSEMPIAFEIMKSSSAVSSPMNSHRRTLPPVTPSKQSPNANYVGPSIFDSMTLSRYRLDFEEIEFLGKGGFGEVVKARNRIDGRFYAIKKIKLDANDRDGSKRILREVQTLSRLHHQFVVRYYQAWFEDGTGETWHDDSDDEDSEDSEDSESSDVSHDSDFDQPIFEDDWLSFSKTKKSYPSISISFGHGSQRNGNDTLETFSTDGASPTPTDEGGRRKARSNRVLYIQMEYCEKKTLRDVIDEGIDDEEGWRLFRQILEGLAHIHSQGMIHRDLKPSNVFLDASGNVKIGDFGLALSREDEGGLPKVVLNGMDGSTGSLDPEGSFTGEVGTPVYVAPEIVSGHGKYNSKVDLYSLGICFFEMCYPFTTGMHRALVLRELRQPSITMPQDFEFKRYDAQSQIILTLLNHAPKERPSAAELLQSPLLPPTLEEEYISEALRSIVNQNNPLYYSRLVTSLFAQSTDRHKDFTYEFNSNALTLDQLTSLVTGRMYAHALNVFARHGAVNIRAPLLIPKGDLHAAGGVKKVVELVDSTGCIVQLPFDLTAPFARLIARVSQDLTLPLKRYVIDNVYRSNTVGGQPRTILECDFDIITSNLGNMCPDAEVIKVVYEMLELSAAKYSNPSLFVVRLNHCSLLEAIFDTCKISTDFHVRTRVHNLLEQLHRPMNWTQLRPLLVKDGISVESVNALTKFQDLTGDFENVAARVESMMDQRVKPAFREMLSQLRLLMSHLQHLGIKSRVDYAPLLVYNASYYKNGLMFQIGLQSKKKLDVVAAGGRYDHLLGQFRYPFGPSKKLHGVGVHFAMSKAISAIVLEEAEHIRSYSSQPGGDDTAGSQFRRVDVLVVSVGKSGAAADDRMAIISDLWNAGISADMTYYDVQSPQDIFKRAKAQGYKLCVMVKNRNPDVQNGLIKVKNLSSKMEEDVSRNELLVHVQSELADTTKSEPFVHAHAKPRRGDSGHNMGEIAPHHHRDFDSSGGNDVMSLDAHSVVVVQPPWKKGKVKHKDKLMSMEKATHAVCSEFLNLKRGMVFVIDLPENVLKKLTGIDLKLPEESFKKLFDTLPSNQREYLSQIKRQIIRHHKEDHQDHFWLYSTVDGDVHLYSFA